MIQTVLSFWCPRKLSGNFHSSLFLFPLVFIFFLFLLFISVAVPSFISVYTMTNTFSVINEHTHVIYVCMRKYYTHTFLYRCYLVFVSACSCRHVYYLLDSSIPFSPPHFPNTFLISSYLAHFGLSLKTFQYFSFPSRI